MISIMNINKKILNVIYKVLAVMLALILWEIVALKIDSPILLVTPVQVLGRLFTIWHEPGFAGTVWFTMYHIVGGFLAGLLCGIICAVLAYICKPCFHMHYSHRLRQSSSSIEKLSRQRLILQRQIQLIRLIQSNN